MIVRIADAVAELMAISRQYPKEHIMVRIQDGQVRVGFAKGAYGDLQHSAWLATAPFMEVRE